MSLFLEITKRFLSSLIGQAKLASVVADDSLANKVASFFGKGRNTELSAAKRLVATAFLNKLKTFHSHGSDETDKAALANMVRVLATDLGIEIGKHKEGEGQSGSLIEKAAHTIENIYQACKLLQLTGQAYNPKNPLHILQSNMTLYYALRIDKLSALNLDKKVNVSVKLAYARSQSSAFDFNDPAQISRYHEFILNVLDQIRQGNRNACDDNTPEVNLPLMAWVVTISAPFKIRPSTGHLERLCAITEGQIRALTPRPSRQHAAGSGPGLLQAGSAAAAAMARGFPPATPAAVSHGATAAAADPSNPWEPVEDSDDGAAVVVTAFSPFPGAAE